jgi:hypothetical protein
MLDQNADTVVVPDCGQVLTHHVVLGLDDRRPPLFGDLAYTAKQFGAVRSLNPAGHTAEQRCCETNVIPDAFDLV